MAGEVVVDALPYIDQGYDEPGVREAVNINNLFRPYHVIILFFRPLQWLKKNAGGIDQQKIT